jgi:hypothetical protein
MIIIFRMWLRFFMVACVVNSLISVSVLGEAYSPAVYIKTKAPQPGSICTGDDIAVKGVTVEFWDEDSFGYHDYHGVTFTSNTGLAQVSFSDVSVDTPDIFVKVKYEFMAPDGKKIQVFDPGSSSLQIYQSSTWSNISPGYTVLGTYNLPDDKANIGNEARDCLIKMKGACPTWTVPKDLIAYAAMGSPNGGGTSPVGGYIQIGYNNYTNPADALTSFGVIHHETGHWIMAAAYNQIPVIDPHNRIMQTNEVAAFSEAWADYVAYYTATPDWYNTLGLFDGIQPQKYWRGGDNTGTNNSGDIVEGAILNAWALIGDMEGTFKVLLDDHPTHYKAWLDGYGADKAWNINSAFEASQANGMVYTRGTINGFLETDPPNTTPFSDGDQKKIGGLTFLRGIVTPSIMQKTRADLLLSPSSGIILASKMRLGYKNAAVGLSEATTPANWTFLGEKAWIDYIKFDTKTLGDGDYDLIIQTENGHGWWDNFDPDFADDSIENRNSDEKWLKHQRTWYNQDADPTDDVEGKVIIDNKAPTIKDHKPI